MTIVSWKIEDPLWLHALKVLYIYMFPYFRASCESPSVAGDYLRAAKAWHKLHLLVDSVPYSEKYTSLIEALEQANEVGTQEGDCSMYSW